MIKMNLKMLNLFCEATIRHLNICFILSCVIVFCSSYYAYSAPPNSNCSNFIDQYFKSKGLGETIVFDTSNIKMYWINKDVSIESDDIQIILNHKTNLEFFSEPLKIQLANVIETQDCRIDIVADTDDFEFSVKNNYSNTLSTSSKEDDFIQYKILSTTFHLEDADNFSFNLVFTSKTNPHIAIKKIVLSFSENQQSAYRGSLGFESLSKEIEKNGLLEQESGIKYLISKQYKRVYILIPNQLASKHSFFYHVYPLKDEDILQNRKQYKYNNYDFKFESNHFRIPKPFDSKSEYEILQIELPPYDFSLIYIGQYDSNKRIWRVEIK